MTWQGWAQIAVFTILVAALARPLGGYMMRVFNGEKVWLSPILRPIESVFYAIAGVKAKEEQGWKAYAFAMLAINLAGFLLLYAILRFIRKGDRRRFP